MLEYIIVFSIVGVAAFFTINKLIKDTKEGSSCDDCTCECDIPDRLNKITEIAEKNRAR